MRPWFQSRERQEALWDLGQCWVGTPFFERGASNGHGVDCLNLLYEIFWELKAIEPFELPHYSMDQSYHSADQVLIRFLMTEPMLRGRLVFVPFESPKMPGDIIGGKLGYTDYHLGLMQLWGKVLHALPTQGVILQNITEKRVSKRILYILRLMEKEEGE